MEKTIGNYMFYCLSSLWLILVEIQVITKVVRTGWMRNIECISLLQILTASGGNNRERLIVQYCNSNVFISFSRRGILIFATIKHSLVPSVDAVQCAPWHQLGSRTDGGTMIIFSSVVGTQSVRCHHCALLVYINITCPLIGDRSIVSVRGIYRRDRRAIHSAPGKQSHN